ncbi:hypothetical protein B0H11DRAFT_2252003 [Mycena galericulata]|nr:hypothetical protein B0H11DRAFT_2252003 [Mycena galericulata]
MTTLDDSSDYEDAEIVALIASLDLGDGDYPPRRPSPPPRTPSPRLPPVALQRHTFPAAHNRTLNPARTPVVYCFESPTRRGLTTEWSLAGSATQGVADAHVSTVSGRRKKKKSKKAAYVVFCGRRFGVFRTWREVKALVNGVSNCIFRGYKTVRDAEAAFQYALSHGWVRTCSSPVTAAIPSLPTPASTFDIDNPLSGTEPHDQKQVWYVVYRGITPGVYRSHLESQLNTLGVRGALYESIEGKAAALQKFADARHRGDIAEVLPPYPDDVFS